MKKKGRLDNMVNKTFKMKLVKRTSNGVKTVEMYKHKKEYLVIVVDNYGCFDSGKSKLDAESADMFFNKTAFELGIGETK